ncbi:uncharacterized protein VTP21DRAFT_9084 [Calcarisporiella thermophila]|uniref:uncharacterized protein n=1 Tax=Calcarisporiella thermophila TaxID=911321 RepID=UPI003743B9D4
MGKYVSLQLVDAATPSTQFHCPVELTSITSSISPGSNQNESEAHSQDHMDSWSLLSTADALRFELRLTSVGDLHRLLSAQFMDKGSFLREYQFQCNLPVHGDQNFSSQRCTIFDVNLISKPIKEIDIKQPTKTNTIKRKLSDRLFHVYLSDCFYYLMHPDQASFLESYYQNELEPALVHTAIAFSAVHLLLAHPQTPKIRQVHLAIGRILTQARESLEDIFDAPSPQGVLAFLNMETCMRWLGRFDEAYSFYSQAVLMAFALRMDRDDPSDQDPVQIEFRRRIWSFICKRELSYSFEFDKPTLISLELIKNSPKPTVNSNDRVRYKVTLLHIMQEIIFATKMMELKNIDWSLPDFLITQQLLNLAAFLQRDLDELMFYSKDDILPKYHNFDANLFFWLHWCLLWKCFIKSDAPPGRLETDTMQQLQAKALIEFVKGLTHSIKSLQAAISNRNWCKNYPFVVIQLICENCIFISHTHPSIAMRRLVFRELAQALHLLHSIAQKGVIEGWMVQQIVEALEEMKNFVFSQEELKLINSPKQRTIAIKPATP